MSLLLNLPVSIGHTILSTWLVNQDYARLDIAHCGNADRSTFLERLTEIQEIDVVICWESQKQIFIRKLQWMMARHVTCALFSYHVVDVELTPADLAVLNDYLALSAPHQTCVYICSNHAMISTLLRLIIDHKLALTKLSVQSWDRISRHAPWDIEIGTILHNSAAVLVELMVQCSVSYRNHIAEHDLYFPSLRTLDITGVNEKDLVASAPNLVHLALKHPLCDSIYRSALVEIAQLCRW